VKIKGIRHVGIHVDNKNFSKMKSNYKALGGTIISDNCYDGRPYVGYGDIHTCKIQFDDGSILELTTDVNHIAYNVTGWGSEISWDKDRCGNEMELVKCKKK